MTVDRVAREALDRALEEKEDLLLVYQPIHDARSREIVAAEALLRQRRKTGEIREARIITKTAERGPELFELNSMTVRRAFTDAGHDLKDLGLELWLDDFGTGHSSLAHLQHFPLDGLKLPGEFIANLPGEARCSAITRALIALAHDLHLEVIAEGVETEDQLQFLLSHKCDSIQGFLFSKPMPLEEFEGGLDEELKIEN